MRVLTMVRASSCRSRRGWRSSRSASHQIIVATISALGADDYDDAAVPVLGDHRPPRRNPVILQNPQDTTPPE